MRGLFGKRMPMPGVISGFGGGTFNMDGSPVGMPDMQNVPTTAGGRFGNPLPPAMPAKEGGGWKNVLLGALGGAADGAATFFGGRPLIAEQQQFNRFAAMRQAEQERARAMNLADFERRQQLELQYRPPPAPTEFERALAMANIDPASPEGQALARERAQRMAQGPDPLLQGAPIRGGGTYTGPYSGYAAMMQGGGQGQGAPDTLPADFFDNPQGQRPMQAPAQPIHGARTINRQQYEAKLREFGGDQMSMNTWMRANNVIAGN